MNNCNYIYAQFWKEEGEKGGECNWGYRHAEEERRSEKASVLSPKLEENSQKKSLVKWEQVLLSSK